MHRPSASAIFKYILEVVFCDGVQYRLRFYLDHFSCAKMAVSSMGKQEHVIITSTVKRTASCCDATTSYFHCETDGELL
jgi:hypothetical protein